MKLTRSLLGSAVAILGVLAVAAPRADAAGIPPELQAVKRWRLSFDYEELGNVMSSDSSWQLAIRASGSAVLERTSDPYGEWLGTPQVSVSYSYTGTRGDAMCRTDEQVMGAGSPEDLDLSASLRFFEDGYQIEPSAHYVAVSRHYTLVCPDTQEGDETGERYYYQHGIISDSIAYPSKGLELRGTLHADQKPNSEETIGDISSRSQATLNYTLTPELDPLVLELDDATDYAEWRPDVGDIRGAPGRPVSVRAELKSESGDTPKVKVKQFIWSLSGTSHEPGFSMNFPIDSDDTGPDLRLDTEDMAGVELSDEDQRLERLLPTPALKDEVQVVPYDRGAWSTLKVTAVLEDDRMIEGTVKSSGEPELLLPKRDPDSVIADSWKKRAGVKGKDASDDENAPEGDGNVGDGLTLYEEYRGFFQAGEVVEGDPKKKDLFVLAAQPARTGVALFQRLSKLAVHGRLRASELPESRVINGNRSLGPNVTAQHALKVVVSPHFGETAASDHGLPSATQHADLQGQAVGGPGSPKEVSEIRLMRSWSALPIFKRDRVVAHELFHAVNVYHHGESDEIVAWGLKDDELIENSSKGEQTILVFREPDVDITDRFVNFLASPKAKQQPLLGWLGVEGGQHSGDDACVMRYNAANAYVGTAPLMRYVTKEQGGLALCTDPSGTGVNDPARDPQSRFGAAAENRGDCAHQILVNDAVAPPRR